MVTTSWDKRHMRSYSPKHRVYSALLGNLFDPCQNFHVKSFLPFVLVTTVVNSLEDCPISTPAVEGTGRIRPDTGAACERLARRRATHSLALSSFFYFHRSSAPLFDPLSITTTPTHLAAPLPSPKPAFHGNVDLTKALDCTRIIPTPHHKAAARACAEQNAVEKREAFVLVFIFDLWRRRVKQIQRQGKAFAIQYSSAWAML
jgi:hypothetical protein